MTSEGEPVAQTHFMHAHATHFTDAFFFYAYGETKTNVLGTLGHVFGLVILVKCVPTQYKHA